MAARRAYVRFHNKLNDAGKRKTRLLFISLISKTIEGFVEFCMPDVKVDMCPTLLTRVFGFSINVPWYSKTVQRLSEAIHELSRVVQFNSINEIMLPPNYNSRIRNVKIPIATIRKRMNMKLRVRKFDSLTRCNICSSIPPLITSAKSDGSRREAENALKRHYWMISQQRTIIECLARQSRDANTDVTVLLMDSMSNRCTKLPSLSSRPKSIGDVDRVNLNLTTVQICEDNGENKMRNIEFPILQGLFSSDSSYNLSVLFHALTKLNSISSTLVVIMDSCRANKSFTFISGIGFDSVCQLAFKPAGLCSNGVITVSKMGNGTIAYSSQLTMNSSQLVGAESDQSTKKLFMDNFYENKVAPSILCPTTSDTNTKIETLLRNTPAIFSEDNKKNFKNATKDFGTQCIANPMNSCFCRILIYRVTLRFFSIVQCKAVMAP
ncbi:unnamed protein product [Caenorhabditis brenneri]